MAGGMTHGEKTANMKRRFAPCACACCAGWVVVQAWRRHLSSHPQHGNGMAKLKTAKREATGGTDNPVAFSAYLFPTTGMNGIGHSILSILLSVFSDVFCCMFSSSSCFLMDPYNLHRSQTFSAASLIIWRKICFGAAVPQASGQTGMSNSILCAAPACGVCLQALNIQQCFGL